LIILGHEFGEEILLLLYDESRRRRQDRFERERER
jgi:hypothetical protein